MMRATNAKRQAKQSLLGFLFLLILKLGMLPPTATIPLRQDSGRGFYACYLSLLVMSITTNLFSRLVGCLGKRGQADTCPALIALALYTVVYGVLRIVRSKCSILHAPYMPMISNRPLACIAARNDFRKIFFTARWWFPRFSATPRLPGPEPWSLGKSPRTIRARPFPTLPKHYRLPPGTIL